MFTRPVSSEGGDGTIPAGRYERTSVMLSVLIQSLHSAATATLFRGDRAGQHSIRINDQWRICFVWADGGAHDMEIILNARNRRLHD